jgi:hypothetical protein
MSGSGWYWHALESIKKPIKPRKFEIVLGTDRQRGAMPSTFFMAYLMVVLAGVP